MVKTEKESLLKRYEGNPIITPDDVPGSTAVFNCGQTMYDGRTVLLLSIDWADRPSTVRVATSEDGIHFDIAQDDFFKPEGTSFEPYAQRIIDTRVTKIDDTYYIVFPSGGRTVLGMQPCGLLSRTQDFRAVEIMDIIALPVNRVPCLFPEKINGKYCKIDRPGGGPTGPGQMWISFSPDLIHWGSYRFLIKPYADWNMVKIGPVPPIRTEQGWLVLIHGVERHPCAGNSYRLGAIMLDIEDPTQVIGRTEDWILAPAEPYEVIGNVHHVVFICGCIPDYDEDRLRVYYGAADTCIGLATCKLSELIERTMGDG